MPATESPSTACRVSAVAAIAAVIGLLLWLGLENHWVLCWTNCGETFDALLYVENFRITRFTYALLQDMATAPWPEAHPFLYTHNPNIAGFVFLLLDSAGLTNLAAKQVVTVAIFALGLTYLWLAVRFHTRSSMIALATLLLFCVDIEHVVSYGLNPLRAWHWVALFGLIYHVGRIAEAGEWKDYILILLFGTAALGVGYDYWIICAAISVTLLLSGATTGRIRKLAILAMLLTGPALMRQAQVAYGIGPVLWWSDLTTSMAVKIPTVSRFIRLPASDVLDQKYSEWNILRPPATVSSLGESYRTFEDMLGAVLVPGFGAISLVVFALVAVVSVGALAIFARFPGCQQRVRINEAYISLPGTARLITALTAGIGAGLCFFAPVSLHIYMKHGFPLLAAPLHLAKAVVIVGALYFFFRRRRANRLTYSGGAAFVIAVLLIVDTAVVNARNVRELQPVSTAWIDRVGQLKGSSFAVSWIPNSVSVFTKQWAVGIAPGRERIIVQRLAHGVKPIERQDLFLFGERDAAHKQWEYLQPSYWLYFPVDQNNFFDHPVPRCRSDWFLSTLKPILSSDTDERLTGYEVRGTELGLPAGGNVVLRVYGRLHGKVSPSGLGGAITIEARSRASPRESEDAQTSSVLTQSVLNCIYGTFELQAVLPLSMIGPNEELHLKIRDASGTVVEGAPLRLPKFGTLPAGYDLRQPQLTAKQVMDSAGLPVISADDGYVILDLRGAYR